MQLSHHISNFTLRSGRVFVKKAAPTVEACDEVVHRLFALKIRWLSFQGFVAPGNQRIGLLRTEAPGCSYHYPFRLKARNREMSRPEASLMKATYLARRV